jgi:hypothetical protein
MAWPEWIRRGEQGAAARAKLRERWTPAYRRASELTEKYHAHVLLAVVVIVNLYVLFSVKWMPLQDVGGHAELMDIMARGDDPSTSYPDRYEVNSAFTANGIAMLTARLLGPPLIPTLVLIKLFLAFYVAGMPLALFSLARAFRRPPWLAVFAGPLVFNAVWNFGFLNFLIALPLVFWSLAVARTFAEKGGWLRGAGLAVLLNLVFLSHILAFLMTVPMVALVLVLFMPGPRRGLRLTPVLLAVPMFGVWFWQRMIAGQATPNGRTFLSKAGDLGTDYKPLAWRLQELSLRGMTFLKNNKDEIAQIVLLFAWLALVAAAVHFRKPPDPLEERPSVFAKAWGLARDHTLEILTLGCLAGHFLLPTDVREVQIISLRAWWVALFLLPLWIRVPLRLSTAWLAAPVLFIAVWYPLQVRKECRKFDRQVLGDLPTAIASLNDRTGLACVFSTAEVPMVEMNALWHLPRALHTTLNGGWSNDNFAIRPYYPIDIKAGKVPPPLNARFWADPDVNEWDYVIFWGSSEPTEAIRSDTVGLRWHQNGWWLFEVYKNPAWKVPIAGGRGGSAVLEECRTGERLAGIEVSDDTTTIGAMRILCDNAPAGKPPQLRDGTWRGGAPATQTYTRLSCPAGSRMTGIYGRANSMVRSLGVICAGPDGTPVDLPPRGGAEGSAFRLACPGGRAVVGFKVRFGGWLDAAGPICEGGARPKTVQPPAGPSPAAQPPAPGPAAAQPSASPFATARPAPAMQRPVPRAVPTGIQAR